MFKKGPMLASDSSHNNCEKVSQFHVPLFQLTFLITPLPISIRIVFLSGWLVWWRGGKHRWLLPLHWRMGNEPHRAHLPRNSKKLCSNHNRCHHLCHRGSSDDDRVFLSEQKLLPLSNSDTLCSFKHWRKKVNWTQGIEIFTRLQMGKSLS